MLNFGSTTTEAIAAAKEAITCHIEGLLANDAPIPTPSSVDKHKNHSDYVGGVWAIVEININVLTQKICN